MFGRFALRLYELAHEVPQELRAAAVAGLGGCRKLVFQYSIHPERKCGLTHAAILHALQ
ncbi:Unknown protein sequence [Pseudomonas savastanoi pv. glycinea]|uniref:Uncharacterized protein n=1 Tax=Pseudomonas savastanoi pv. glycinea TaxID=318 RepID=A0ABR5L2B6_PSESG|nr:Unknown protein sequence [Pseudomonas savastanoi pv. phaseolicola]KPB60319.1 Unknown protein sequence [Pseudomonas amygdali pv. mellea]KPB85335.1 Unknown protein sequence [Pseudomonas syringae pv. maculicola]KPC23211.1 Unknown protein sequence [Pseudomonas savastanoi pv. glycinea]KPB44530.1 Unknown protein sequence [Pseudomonas savastanoi pv. phaseolicola]